MINSFKKLGKFLTYMLLVFIGVATYVIIYPPKEEPVDIYVSASGACKIVIKRLANNPDSVEFFHSRMTEIVKRKNGVWIVKVPYRAKNGFNATVFSEATCYLRHDGDLWHIINVR